MDKEEGGVASETVSVLFTDLVGSTELATGLGPDAADEVRRAHFGLLRGAVADAGGTEVKNLGDGLMVVFSSPSQALACAAAMQQAVDRHNRSSAEALAIRIGVSLGEVVAENDDYFGEPVVEAARLCAAADGGQILVADVVRALVRGRGHAFVPLGELTLKGLPEPVPACELTWEPAAEDAATIPLPPRLETAPTAGFVGRAAERETLADAEKRASAGDGQQIVLVGGEGGMGKTTLTAEAARDAHRRGAVVLYGRCDEDLGIPYQPFAEALHHYVVHAPDDWLERHDPGSLAELTRLVPALTKRLPDLPAPTATDPENERYLLYHAVAAVLADVAGQAPVVLVLDDLHWSDKPSLLLLRFLAGTGASRLLVLGTYRDNELSSAHPLTEALAALRREDGVQRIGLSGFNDTEVIAFMEAAAGHTLDNDGLQLGHALFEETDGNPFFVREVLLHLVETGAIVQHDERWVATGELDRVGLPASVREVIGARVSRLGPDASGVLSAAAVIGQEFDLELLCAMTDREEESVLDALDAAKLVALVTESTSPGSFRFAHALIQHTLYEDLGPTRQARLHQQAAAALEELCGADGGTDVAAESYVGERIGELARHYLAATRPAETAKAAVYARQAGNRAMAAAAPDEALHWFRDALAAAGTPGVDPRERVLSLIGLGHAKRLSGEPFRDDLLEASRLALELDDTPLLVRTVLMNTRGLSARTGYVNADVVAMLEAALERVGAGDSVERARLLSTLCAELSFDPDPDRRTALADEAIAVARRTGDDAALFDAIVRTCMPTGVPERAEWGLALQKEAMAISDRAEDPDPGWSSYPYFWWSILQVELGQIEGVDDAMDVLRDVVRRVPSPQLRWGLSLMESWRAMLAGTLDEAERLMQLAYEEATSTGQPEAFSFYTAQLFVIRYMQGRLAEMVPLVGSVAEEDVGLPAFWAAVALAEALEGDRARAEALVEEQVSRRFDLPYEANWLTGMVSWAEVVSLVGNREAAAILTEQLRPYPHLIQMGSIVAVPGVAHALGVLGAVLGRDDEADAYFAQALEIHGRLEAPYFVAWTAVRWAEALVTRDPHHARALASEALDLAERHGFGMVERKARGVLA